MPVPFVTCRNKVTGAEAEVPKTALPHMTDWVPIDEPAETVRAAPAALAEKPATATKSKAANPAATEKE